MLMRNISQEETRAALKIRQSMFLEDSYKTCRICLETENDNDKPIIHPCKCKGSVGEVHELCLKTWIVSQNKTLFTQCELCKFEYQVQFTSKKVCIPRKVCKNNIENLIALACLFFVFGGFLVLQIFIILQIQNIYDGNDKNNSESDIFNSPITMIGFCVLVFIFLVPISICLVYLLKKILFITKIKAWRILNRPQTPPSAIVDEMHQSFCSKPASNKSNKSQKQIEIPQQLPKLTQTTQILIQSRNNDYEHVQFL